MPYMRQKLVVGILDSKSLKALNLVYNKNELYETLVYWSGDILKFDFLEKRLGRVSQPHFVYDFLRKMFPILYFIDWLSDCFYFLRYWAICEIYEYVINFEINLIFRIKSFFYMTKKSRQKLKYLQNKKSFQVNMKSIFQYY